MYTFDSRVRYSEVGEDARLSLDGVINYMQDCSSFESEDLGVGIEMLEQEHLTWVLSFWQIVIHRYPKLGERITVGTQAYDFQKMFGYRNFLLTGQEQEHLAIANSIWVLMDMDKGRPRVMRPEEGTVYGTEGVQPLPMEYASRKIKVPEIGQEQKHFQVQEYHLDTNHHVNNGQYVRMATTYLPKGAQVKELRVEYKKQAVLGDEVVPVVYDIPEGVLITLTDLAGKPYAVVEFFLD